LGLIITAMGWRFAIWKSHPTDIVTFHQF